MRRFLIISLTLTLLAASVPRANAATITIVNSDSPGEGFNDNTVVAPVGGNPGTTRGQQRLNVFQHAADIWGAILESPVVIKVEARFNPLTCSSTGAVLGSAAPIDVFRSFANAPFFNTWYHAALADKISGSNREPSHNDIVATFNSALDNNCFPGGVWYYGLDGNEAGDIELLPVVLHELGHGLGFSSVVSLASGAEMLFADDMGDYYRVPADNRDLNYDLYYTDGEPTKHAEDDYNSHNTHRLDVAGMTELLHRLPIIKRALDGEPIGE